VSPNNIWAVGYTYTNDYVRYETLIEHWNGMDWRVVPSPNGDVHNDNWLYGVALISPKDLWAIGWSTGTSRPILAHYYEPCVPVR